MPTLYFSSIRNRSATTASITTTIPSFHNKISVSFEEDSSVFEATKHSLKTSDFSSQSILSSDSFLHSSSAISKENMLIYVDNENAPVEHSLTHKIMSPCVSSALPIPGRAKVCYSECDPSCNADEESKIEFFSEDVVSKSNLLKNSPSLLTNSIMDSTVPRLHHTQLPPNSFPRHRRLATSPPKAADELEEASIAILVTTYLGYLILIVFGHIRDFFGKIFKRQEYKHLLYHDVRFSSPCICTCQFLRL